MFVWITLTLVLIGYVCEAERCDYERLNSCSSVWGYSNGYIEPDETLWDMDVFTDYCRLDNQETFSTCVGRVMSSDCQLSRWQEHVAFFRSVADMVDLSIRYMCSNIDVIEANRECIDAADRNLTQCHIDSGNRAEAEFLEMGRNGDNFDFELINAINKRVAWGAMNCVDGVLMRICNREVAIPFKNFYYAAYLAHGDEQ